MRGYGYWRGRSAPIITEVIERVGKDDMKALRKALREAYPFGAREYWPYKVWCSEVRIQLKLDIAATPLFDNLKGD